MTNTQRQELYQDRDSLEDIELLFAQEDEIEAIEHALELEAKEKIISLI